MIWIFFLSLLPMGTHQVHKLYALLCFIAGGSLINSRWNTTPSAPGWVAELLHKPDLSDTLRLFASLF